MARRPVTATGTPNEAQPASTFASDDALRRLFLKTSLRMSQPLDAIVNPAAGNQYSVRVPGVGIARFVRLFVQATVTVTVGTGTAVLAQRGPYNLISRILFQDPGGTPRITCSGYELYLLHVVSTLVGGDPSVTTGPVYAPMTTEVYNAPAANGANLWNFWLHCPFELSALDTRGVMNLESATSNASMMLTINPAIFGTTQDSPIFVTGNATAALTACTITPVYYFYSPVYLYDSKGVPSLALPTDDLTVMHEVMTSRDTMIPTGVDKRQTLPSGRTYQRIISQLISNNTPVTGTINTIGAAGVTNVRWAYDVSKITMNEPLQAYLARIRDDYNRDFPFGVFLYDLTNRPWDASRYGQLDAILTIDPAMSVVAPTYIDTLREGLYVAPTSG